jgi:hypothetical protein
LSRRLGARQRVRSCSSRRGRRAATSSCRRAQNIAVKGTTVGYLPLRAFGREQARDLEPVGAENRPA